MRVETRKPRSRRANPVFGAAVALAVCLVVSMLAGAFVLVAPGGSASASFLHPQPGALRWDGHSPLTALLIGSPGNSNAGAESLTIVSLDPARHSVHLLSIPSNLWVTIPGFGQAPISRAYADGGPKLALLTVESITHVAIPWYVATSEHSLRSLIDAVGGVTLSVPNAIHVSHVPAASGRGFVNASIARGRRRLDGALAVAYANAARGGITAQLARRQTVMIALEAQSLAPQNLFQIPTIVTSLGGSFPTNFPYDQVPTLTRALASIPRSAVTAVTLNQSNHAVTGSQVNRSVLVPDWYRVRQLAQAVFPQPDLLVSPGVEVLNGSGTVGQAAALSAWLALGGIHVPSFATAPTPAARTEIVVSTSASAAEYGLANGLSALLQAPLVRSTFRRGREHVAVVIGRDYQDLSQQ